jgi:hypothetical protein
VTSSFQYGLDVVSTTVPWAVMGKDSSPAAGQQVEFDVNGTVILIDAGLFAALQSDLLAGRVPDTGVLPSALADMDDSFTDLAGFMIAVEGFYLAEARARTEGTLQAGGGFAPASCISPCVTCAGAVLAGAGSYFALIAACGGALISGGSTALLCFASYLGVQATHLAMFGACGQCYDCISEPKCPCEGQPLCDCI